MEMDWFLEYDLAFIINWVWQYRSYSADVCSAKLYGHDGGGIHVYITTCC